MNHKSHLLTGSKRDGGGLATVNRFEKIVSGICDGLGRGERLNQYKMNMTKNAEKSPETALQTLCEKLIKQQT